MRTRLRSAIFIIITAGFVPIVLISLRDHLEMIGRPVVGFFFQGPAGRISSDSKVADSAGLQNSDEVVEINGRPYEQGMDPTPLVHMELGQVNHLLVRRNGHDVKVDIPVHPRTFGSFFGQAGVGLLIGIIYIAFGAIVFRLRPREPASWPFFLFCAGMGFGLLDFQFTKSVEIQMSAIAGLCLLAPTSMHFVFNLGGGGFMPKFRRRLLPALYGSAAVLAVLPYVFYHLRNTGTGQWIMLAVAVWVSCAVTFSIPLLAFMAAKNPLPLNRQRARILLFGIVMAFALPSAAFVYNMATGRVLVPIWFSYSLLAFYPVTVAYAMVRHRLFDLDVVLRKSLVYVLLSGALSLVYVAGLVLLNAGFAGKVGGTGSTGTARLVLFVIVSVVIVFFLDRVRGFAQTVVDRLFFRQRVDYRRALLQASEAMASRLRQSEILDTALGAIRDAMGVDWGAVFLAREGRSGLRRTGSFGEGPAGLGERLLPDDPFVQLLGQGRQAVSRYDREVQDDPLLAEHFDAARTALAVPFVVEERLVGVLLLGQKRSGRLYGAEDFELLETLANQSGIALMNARAVETIHELNVGLEQKVRDRTAELEAANNELARSEAAIRQAYEELSSAQTRLVQAEKMAALGSLVAGITHEFNSPVGAIVAANDVIERSIGRIRGAGGGMETDRALKVVTELTRTNRESCARIAAIVRNLKSFARLDEAERKTVDLQEGIESALSLIGHMTGERIRVVRNYVQLPQVNCNPSQMNQVFMHLLTNACQAINADGVITITTQAMNGKVSIKVSDTGRGIPPEDLPRLFDPGYTTKRGVAVGLGLGLSICQQVVSAHGGSIEVESQPGIGSTFTIMLPVG